MKWLTYLLVGLSITISGLYAQCEVPKSIQHLVKKSSLKGLKKDKDVQRNESALGGLCLHTVEFKEGKYDWKMLLVTHPTHSKGVFWFLPHDDEDTAFDAAVHATKKYGGGFLAVRADDKRHFKGQDPNRNFGDTKQTAKTCKKQKYPAPKYSQIIFSIIDNFKAKGIPYMALHNNKDGWHGNGGHGSVSILNSSKMVHSYPATKQIKRGSGGLNDEDTLVYIAGFGKKPDQDKLGTLLDNGLNTKYEIINKKHNDCSLSNYVVLRKKTTDYFNIETEHKDLDTQKVMIDKIIQMVK
jgi:hypothetical protein